MNERKRDGKTFHCGSVQSFPSLLKEGMLRFHQMETIVTIVVHTQVLDRRITMPVVGHVNMDTTNVIFDSVF